MYRILKRTYSGELGFMDRSYFSPQRLSHTIQKIDENMGPGQQEQLDDSCILVNDADKVVGSASKLKCHKKQDDGSFLLHRAFSLLLFDTQNRLLLQRRALGKITFPGA